MFWGLHCCFILLNAINIFFLLLPLQDPAYLVLQFLCSFVNKMTLTSLCCVAQLVKCLATEACLTADSGVSSWIPARSHTFVEIDHEIISTVILLPSAESYKKGCVSDTSMYVHKALVNRLFKLAEEKVWLGALTVPQLLSC